MNIGRFAQSKLIRFFFPASERASGISHAFRMIPRIIPALTLFPFSALPREIYASSREDDFQGKGREKCEIRIGRRSNPAVCMIKCRK